MTSEKAQKPKVHSSSISSSSSSNMSCWRQDSDYSVVPSTPLVPPIVHSATYRVDSVEHFNQLISQGGYVYIRFGNPTCEAAEKAINSIEGGFGSVLFGSGMAAITTTLLTFLQPGDHIVVSSELYGCTYEFVKHYLRERLNVDVTFVDNVQEFKAAILPNTKLLYAETMSNPLMTVLDLEQFGQLGSDREGAQHERLTIVDATFSSPQLVKPIKHGIDIVIHSATKFLGGHEDLCAGVLTTRTDQQWKKIIHTRQLLGGILSPRDASLLLRGLKTLSVRTERQSETAHHLALFLSTHPAVCQVNYPGLPSHPEHHIAKRLMTKFGSVLSFVVVGSQHAAVTVANSLRVFKLAVSLGGVDSLVEHPASMSHGPFCMSDDDRQEAHIDPALIRLSVGLEDAEELLGDLQQALDLVMTFDSHHNKQ